MTKLKREEASYRDPSGHVFEFDGRIIRTVADRARNDYEYVRDSGVLGELIDRGLLVSTKELDDAAIREVELDAAYVLEHERIPWVSFPYEWTFSALKSAALAHLDLQLTALERGVALSDASAYNMQFIGSRPVFIDVLSLRRYREGEFWIAQNQFNEQFLNPLLLRVLTGVPHNAWYRGNLEGIATEHLNSLVPIWRKLGVNLFTHVALPSILDELARRKSTSALRQMKQRSLPLSRYRTLLMGSRQWISKLQLKNTGKTTWEDYEDERTYSSSEARAKREFISVFVNATKPKLLWDLGCNAGEFSETALRSGASYVVGFDVDHGALEKAFARSRQSELMLQTLYQDAANPSPNQGWQLTERKSTVARGAPNAILALAFEHHLAIGRNVPIVAVVDWLTSLAPRGVIEFVQKNDPTVQRMLALREDIFDEYSEDTFRAALESRARIIRRESICSCNRIMYWFDRGSDL